MINTINSYVHVTGTAAVQAVTGACTLVSVIVNTTASGTLTISDSLTTTTPAVAVLKSSIVEGTYTYNVTLGTGLRITAAAVGDYTIVYRVH